MWLHALLQRWRARLATKHRVRPPAARRRGTRLTLEQLEDRTVPSNFTAASVSDLIADINAANQQGGSNTIALVAPAASPYVLTAVDNTTDGGNVLPVIATGDNLTIIGNGDTIDGGNTGRLFDVAGGAALMLQNLTLQHGQASGWGGGAIYNQGALTLNGVTVQSNSSVVGGGLYVAGGTVSLTNDTLQSNSAERGGGLYVAGGTVSLTNDTLSTNSTVGYGPAGTAVGGGMCVFGGTVTMTNDTLSGNTAVSGAGLPGRAGTSTQPNGGNGSAGAPAYGGGLGVFGGTVTLNNVTVTGNLARGGNGGNGGNVFHYSSYASPGNGGPGGSSYGGGLYVGPSGTVTLVNDTISSNTAQGGAGGTGGTATRKSYPNGYLHPPVVYPIYGSPGAAGLGEGGGLYIDTLASVCLDAFTLAHVSNNRASTSYPDIFGPHTIGP